jgi:hypothetical protein
LLKKIGKIVVLVFASLFTFLITAVIIVLLVFFFNPTTILNSKNVSYAINKFSVFKTWSWKKAEFHHQWISWNHRKFTGSFEKFCFIYQNNSKNIDACMDEVSWNFDLTWSRKTGFTTTVTRPLSLNSSRLIVTKIAEDDSPPPDFIAIWNRLWKTIVPESELNFKSIDIVDKTLGKNLNTKTHLTAKIIKKKDYLQGEIDDYEVFATPEKIIVNGTKLIAIPYDFKTVHPLKLRELKLVADMTGDNIPVAITGKIESATLKVNSLIKKKWIAHNLPKSELIERVLLETRAELTVDKLNKTLFKIMKPPFNTLPAPINIMEGSFKILLTTEKATKTNSVLIKIGSALDLSGGKEFLKLSLTTDFPFNVKEKKIGAIILGLNFDRVSLILPKLEKNRLPPQLKPDARFKKQDVVAKSIGAINKKVKKSKHEGISMKLNVQTENASELQIKTNLLDEIMKLRFSLNIEDGFLQSGFIEVLPLNTTVFKRKIHLTSLRFNFHYPMQTEIQASLDFRLPEYLITLDVEGPLKKPRSAFNSKPPLPQDDIIAVLLFGHPMHDLNSDDKTASKKTNQILSEGILSLSVLYFFAGSPLQSLGYDPEAKKVTAQVGLGAKNSLRVSRESGGLNSAGVRHSLGRGWYIDSSVQKSSSNAVNSSGGVNDYGVLLERIISY